MLASLKIVIVVVCLLLVRFLLTSITGFFCTMWMASCKGPIKFMNACKTSRLVFPSDGVWGSRRTRITQSKTKLELVNRVISAEELQIKTLPFSSDSTYGTIAYNLMEPGSRSRSRSGITKPITMHDARDWFSSSAFGRDSNSSVLSRS